MEGKSLSEQKKLLEELENKNILYSLKRWEKKLLKFLRKLFYNNVQMKEHIKIMENEKKVFDEQIKKENEDYEKISKEIIDEKIREIKLIEENKSKIIEENKKIYTNLIEYLESIKNDREKLIEFFNKENFIISSLHN